MSNVVGPGPSVTSLDAVGSVSRSRSATVEAPPKPDVESAAPPPTSDSHAAVDARDHGGSSVETQFKALPQASDRDAYTFFWAMREEGAHSIVRSGANLIISTGQVRLKVGIDQLGAMVRKGHLDTGSPLVQSLRVFEAAYNAGLSNGATNAILRGFQAAIAKGTPVDKALVDSFTNVAVAAQVEAYVENKDGLASDMRRTADFTKEAFDGQTAGGTLAALKNRTIRTEVIKQAQGLLDDRLHKFTDAFANARESGDYSSAFDALQNFFRTSAQVAETDYWRQRPATVAQSLQSHRPAGPRDGQPALNLSEAIEAEAPVIKGKAMEVAMPAPATPKGVFGRVCDTVRAGFKYLIGQAATATSGTVQTGATEAIRAMAEDVAPSAPGRIWKAPPPLPKPPERPVKAEAPAAPRERGMVETRLLTYLQTLKPGDEAALSGHLGVSIGLEINAIDFVPVVGEGAAQALGLKASVEAHAGVSGELSCEVTAGENGRFAVVFTKEGKGEVGASASVAAERLALAYERSGVAAVGKTSRVTMEFASAEDVAAFLANPRDHGGTVKGDAVAPGRYTAKSEVESFTELEGETRTTAWVAPSAKSTGGSLPGVRTKVEIGTVRAVTQGEAQFEDLTFEVRTHAGTSADGAAASRVTVGGRKLLQADGTFRLASPSVDMDINIKKLAALNKRSEDTDRRFNVLVDKMVQRLNAAMAQANKAGYENVFDLTTTADAVRQALAKLRDRAPAIFARGVDHEKSHELLGIRYTRGDVATLRFDVEALPNGQLGLASPEVGVSHGKKVAFEIPALVFKVEGGVAFSSYRGVAKDAPAVVARSSGAPGETVRTKSDDGQFVAVKRTDGSKTRFDEAEVGLIVGYRDLMAAIKPGADAGTVTAIVNQVVDHLEQELMPKAAEEQGFAGGLDRAACERAVRGALTLLATRRPDLKANHDHAHYTVAFEGFHAVMKHRTILPDQVNLKFALEQDPKTGLYALTNPLARPTNS